MNKLYNQVNHTRKLSHILIYLLVLTTCFASACEQSEVDSTEMCEEGPSPSQVCQQANMTLAVDGDCEPMSEQQCQTITYETSCTEEKEVQCVVNASQCDQEPPSASSICEQEGLVLASPEECESIDCREVSYPSACGEMGRTLCKESDQDCEEDGYPDPNYFCEQEGMVIASEAECQEEFACSTIEFEIACGGSAEVLCRYEMSMDPLPEVCAERNEQQCAQDTNCKWLVPEPWACAEPEELLPAPGCFPMMGCRDNTECAAGEICRSVAFGECDGPGDDCEACAELPKLVPIRS